MMHEISDSYHFSKQIGLKKAVMVAFPQLWLERNAMDEISQLHAVWGKFFFSLAPASTPGEHGFKKRSMVHSRKRKRFSDEYWGI